MSERAEPVPPPRRPRGRPRKYPPALNEPEPPGGWPKARPQSAIAKAERARRISRLLSAGLSIAEIAGRERVDLESLHRVVHVILAGRAP
jgi:hypothetical protein